MSSNWVCHTVAASPSFMTAEDLTTVNSGKLYDFFQMVRFVFLVRVNLPPSLVHFLSSCVPPELCSVIEQHVRDDPRVGEYLTTLYLDVVSDVSRRTQGYPRVGLSQWRRLREARSAIENNPTRTVYATVMDWDPASFRFLDLPREVRDQVYSYLLHRPDGAITIADWDPDCLASRAVHRRTEYDVLLPGSQHPRRTTYMVRGPSAGVYNTSRNRIDTTIMRLCKAVYTESSKTFYSNNTFSFQGTSESTLAFLHDHASHLQHMKRIVMRFSTNPRQRFKGCYNLTCPITSPPRTFIGAWRRSLNALVHTARSLQTFELSIDSTLWTETSWRQGPHHVFNAPRICEPVVMLVADLIPPNIEERNFLQHAARLGGVVFTLSIDGSDERKEKRAFVKALEGLMRERIKARPWLAEDQELGCTCRRRFLRECCIWDRDGKMRRGL